MSREALNKLSRLLIPPAFWLGVWQLGAMAVGRDILLPSPLLVAQVLGKLALTADFWLAALYTLLRVLAGLLLGCGLGAALAVLTYRFRWAELLLSPVIRVLQATPVVCFILLVYLWVERQNIPGLIASLMVLPVIWGSTEAGLRAVDGQLLELARAYRFSPLKTARLVYLPSLWPSLSAALLTAMGLAWKSGVAAEVLCPPKLAVGTEIYHAKTAIETPELFAWTLVIIALSKALELLLRRILGKRGAGR